VTDVTWLGTAGHIVSTGTTTVLIDPYVSRHGLGRLLTRTIAPDDEAIARWIPEKVDAVLCGHSHFDHLLDAPRIARKKGCKLVGSASTCAFARAEGVRDEQLALIPAAGASLTVGDIGIRFVPSLHGRIAFGRVPFLGEVSEPPRLPARVWHYRMGGAFGILLETPGACIYHNGSADLIDAELEGARADVLLVGLAGRKATRDYLKRLCEALSPTTIIPTHHDWFFSSLGARMRLLPGVDMPGFQSEARLLAPRARILTPGYGEPLRLS
jgi:L-ascorbate metabolism protein UlaG (beta-lactamase superfamily)